MADFRESDAQKGLREKIREFARDKILPGAAQRDENPSIPVELIREMGRKGFLGLIVPGELGGAGLGCQEFAILVEETARSCAGTAVVVIPHYLVEYAVLTFGSRQQQLTYLPGLASGEKLAAFAVTESTGGSDVKAFRTKAVRVGEGFRLQGAKAFINNASVADVFVAVGKIDEQMTAFLFPGDVSGIRAGQQRDMIGLRAGAVHDVVFDNCPLEESHILGEVGHGLSVVLNCMNFGRIGSASIAIGIAESALEDALNWARTREAYGKTLSELPTIRFELAGMRTELDAARLLRDRAAWLNDQDSHHALETAEAKLKACRVATDIALKAMQIAGAYGCLKGSSFERHLRDAKAYEIAGGTNEAMKITIARHLF
ncbi:MAG: acyl-CoA dehydrogenase family protein [Deltaproteobacteria bacterium]|nr:acyl-CoA dehydrogenase family protein [Deltaproteobacteria bacterium]